MMFVGAARTGAGSAVGAVAGGAADGAGGVASGDAAASATGGRRRRGRAASDGDSIRTGANAARGGSGISSSVHSQPSRFRKRSVRPPAALGWKARNGAFVSFATFPLSTSKS